MIIDFHTHIFHSEIINDRNNYLDDDQFSILYENPKSKMIDHEELLQSMNDFGVDRSFVMGFPWLSETRCDRQNRYFGSIGSVTGDRIIPFGILPAQRDIDVSYWVSSIKKLGLRGIGEIAFYREGMTRDNLNYLEKIVHHATELRLILCLHMNEPIGHGYPGKNDTSFSGLWSIIKNFPEAEIVLAHWGGGIFFYELMPEIKKGMARVRYDTAASPFLYDEKIYSVAENVIGSEKIIFGSDYPLIAPAKYINTIKKYIANGEKTDNILYKNSLRLIGGSMED